MIDKLYRTYSAMVYRVCLRYVRDPRDAEDLVHAVFMKVLKHIGSFRGQSHVYTWLYRITVNECLHFLRTRKRSSDLLDTLGRWGCDRHPPVDPALLLTLRQVLDLAGRRTRLVVFLIYYEGLTQEEAAEVAGISRRAVNKRLAAFRSRFAEAVI